MQCLECGEDCTRTYKEKLGSKVLCTRCYDKGFRLRKEHGRVVPVAYPMAQEVEVERPKLQITPLEALKALMALIGDQDLPDNGELSGAAVCDMARAVIADAQDAERQGALQIITYLMSKYKLKPQDFVDSYRKLKRITPSFEEPVTELSCESCGKAHKYDRYRHTWDCIVLIDESILGATSILGAWCNKTCLELDWTGITDVEQRKEVLEMAGSFTTVKLYPEDHQALVALLRYLAGKMSKEQLVAIMSAQGRNVTDLNFDKSLPLIADSLIGPLL